MSDNENNDYSDSDIDSESTLSIKNTNKIQKPPQIYNTTTAPENDDIFDDMSDIDSEIDSNNLEMLDKIDNENDDDESELDDDELDDDEMDDEQVENKKKITDIPNMDLEDNEEEEDDEDEDEEKEDDEYFKKLDDNIKKNIISDYHPELHQHNSEEIEALTIVTRNEQGIIIDPLHRTIPLLTKYEKARILGERARQINAGAKIFITVDPIVIDGYLIALKELEQKKIPFIIKRPLPNGGIEYWKLKDLEFLT